MIKHSCLIPRRPTCNPIWNCSNMKSAPARRARFSERLNCNWNVYSISAIPTKLFFFRTRFILKFPLFTIALLCDIRVFQPLHCSDCSGGGLEIEWKHKNCIKHEWKRELELNNWKKHKYFSFFQLNINNIYWFPSEKIFFTISFRLFFIIFPSIFRFIPQTKVIEQSETANKRASTKNGMFIVISTWAAVRGRSEGWEMLKWEVKWIFRFFVLRPPKLDWEIYWVIFFI